MVDPADRRPPIDLLQQVAALINAGQRGAAVRYFMVEGMGAPAFVPTMLRLMPKAWKSLKAVAHTLPFDATIMRGYMEGRPLPARRWASVTMPTLVMCGASKETPAYLVHAARAVAAALPDARLVQRRGLGHTKALNAPTIADTLTEFLTGLNNTARTGDHLLARHRPRADQAQGSRRLCPCPARSGRGRALQA